MKVYVVFEEAYCRGESLGDNINGIYSSKEKAIAAIENGIEGDYSFDSVHETYIHESEYGETFFTYVKEWEVD